MKWKRYNRYSLPPEGVEVLAYNSKWVSDPNSKEVILGKNPKGIRIGRLSNGIFYSASYFESYGYHEYEALEETPEYWLELPEYPESENHKIRMWIARDEGIYEEPDDRKPQKGKLHLFYDTPIIERDHDTNTMKWGYARCIGEIPSHMYPFIEECTRHEIIGEVEKREDYIFEEEP